MRIIASLAALAALSACSEQPWSYSDPTEEQRAIARYLCPQDDASEDERQAAIADYLAARGQSAVIINLPDVGPERDLYCAVRGNALAADA